MEDRTLEETIDKDDRNVKIQCKEDIDSDKKEKEEKVIISRYFTLPKPQKKVMADNKNIINKKSNI